MSAIESPGDAPIANGFKRMFALQAFPRVSHRDFYYGGTVLGLTPRLGRRSSTVLNPRSYLTEDLWKQAPVLTGTTRFEPRADARNILVTGGAGFMCDTVCAWKILATDSLTALAGSSGT
jgi:hypothetical protein